MNPALLVGDKTRFALLIGQLVSARRVRDLFSPLPLGEGRVREHLDREARGSAPAKQRENREGLAG